MRGFDPGSRTFVRAHGTTVFDASGRGFFDATSSIWTILHGHARPEIIAALAAQAATLDHSTLLGATHPAAEELADRLCGLAAMDYAFFSSDGASAVEVAAKMALRYWAVNGQPQRTRFVRLDASYHGDTAAAMSFSDIAVFKDHYASLTFETFAYDASRELLERDDIAAVIVEPLIQAAAGMRYVPHSAYTALESMVPLLIVDEIATGFGRTGTMFAHEQLAVRPDLLCVGKGLSGGVVALSATLASQRIYDAFLADYHEMRQLFHGHSFAGNPIACAAALASLDIFATDATLAAAQRLSLAISRNAELLRTHRGVREIRVVGTMCGIEIRSQLIDASNAQSAGWRIADALYERGHFTRPIGDVIQLVPPLVTRDDEIDRFFTDVLAVLEDVCI